MPTPRISSRYPAVDMTTEFVDALEATRAYEANVGVIEVTKNYGGPGAADYCVEVNSVGV